VIDLLTVATSPSKVAIASQSKPCTDRTNFATRAIAIEDSKKLKKQTNKDT
jgi:hypothetical protein